MAADQPRAANDTAVTDDYGDANYDEDYEDNGGGGGGGGGDYKRPPMPDAAQDRRTHLPLLFGRPGLRGVKVRGSRSFRVHKGR